MALAEIVVSYLYWMASQHTSMMSDLWSVSHCELETIITCAATAALFQLVYCCPFKVQRNWSHPSSRHSHSSILEWRIGELQTNQPEALMRSIDVLNGIPEHCLGPEDLQR